MALEIHLGRGFVALADEADHDRLMQHKWLHHIRVGYGCYARRAIHAEGRTRCEGMHTFLMCPPPGFVVDHINGNGLDNRRCNLRVATRIENARNRRSFKNKTGFKGVRQHTDGGFTAALFGGNTPQLHLGTFRTAQDAARAYDLAAQALFGQFANLNCPEGELPDNLRQQVIGRIQSYQTKVRGLHRLNMQESPR